MKHRKDTFWVSFLREYERRDMFRKLYPSEYIESTYQIDFEKYRKEGYQAVIFDIDNTLVEHGKPADERSIALIEQLKELGYDIMLLSNNKEARVKMFNDAVKVKYIFKAGKPGIKNYRTAMQKMKSDERNTLFVGDQLFTDIWGANRAGIFSILVKPIDKKEEIQIVLKRYLERVVLYFYHKQKN